MMPHKLTLINCISYLCFATFSSSAYTKSHHARGTRWENYETEADFMCRCAKLKLEIAKTGKINLE